MKVKKKIESYIMPELVVEWYKLKLDSMISEVESKTNHKTVHMSNNLQARTNFMHLINTDNLIINIKKWRLYSPYVFTKQNNSPKDRINNAMEVIAFNVADKEV